MDNPSVWDPNQYLKFEKERTQPSLDLVARIPLENPARMVDLGCGPGNSTQILHKRWPKAQIIGVDRSPEMLKKARARVPNVAFVQRDITEDLSDLGPFDLVFSNAALQWLPQPGAVLPGLFQLLAPGGVLAFQVPFCTHMPSHTALQKLIADKKWRQYFAHIPAQPHYHDVGYYYDALVGCTREFDLWCTDYIHQMGGVDDIVEWNAGSALRPFVQSLPDAALQEEFLAAFRTAVETAYVPENNGNTLYSFTRLFAIVLHV